MKTVYSECLPKNDFYLQFKIATAAKSLQSCLTVLPHRWQPTRLPYPWDSPGKNTGVGCHFLLQCMKVKSEREVAQCIRPLATPWTAAHRLLHPWNFPGKSTGVGVPCPLWKLQLPSNKNLNNNNSNKNRKFEFKILNHNGKL